MHFSSLVMSFELAVEKPDFKFNAAHFIVHEGTRERLHGHNYFVKIWLTAPTIDEGEGYVIDFGVVKKCVRGICKTLNEHFLCPAESPWMSHTIDDGQLVLRTNQGAVFSMPVSDALLLPIKHTSAECLAQHIWRVVCTRLFDQVLLPAQVSSLTIGVQEALGQEARFADRPCRCDSRLARPWTQGGGGQGVDVAVPATRGEADDKARAATGAAQGGGNASGGGSGD